jgi:GMP synthase (glutamine-hydrolysing)
MIDSIAILDFGSQYTQLIARRLRAAKVYCELFPWNTEPGTIFALKPKGFILSGSPLSVYVENAPQIPDYVLESNLPILGICYGMQALAIAFNGVVVKTKDREYGSAQLNVFQENPLIPTGEQTVWMSHGDLIEVLPEGFTRLGYSENSPVAFMGNIEKKTFGVQFHPEVQHTPKGFEILRRFAIDICKIAPNWTTESILDTGIQTIKAQVGDNLVLSAVSGGVDSSVATAMVQKAVGDQLVAIFIENGLLRKDEASQVKRVLQNQLGIELIVIDAVDRFMEGLKNIVLPEEKRRVIGELFIRIFEEEAKILGTPKFLVQGTIYPDVVESSAPDRSQAQRIKSHHNVGGLPEKMDFELVEPLRYLFKDEVRAVGEYLGLPKEIVWRQPFPGPGLAVRCLGEINIERLNRLREVDAIFTEELENNNLLLVSKNDDQTIGTSQAFAVLLPIKSVGVMGDQRTYQEVAALRAVTTEDFMTADWARLPYDLVAKISNRIVNEVKGVNRVVYDITSKPPATIEWE